MFPRIICCLISGRLVKFRNPFILASLLRNVLEKKKKVNSTAQADMAMTHWKRFVVNKAVTAGVVDVTVIYWTLLPGILSHFPFCCTANKIDFLQL